MLTQEIKNKVQNLWDRLWAGGLSNPIDAIMQISYLLFMKRLEDFNPNVPDEYKWSNYRDKKDKELVNHIKNKVFKYIQTELSSKDEPFTRAMSDATFIINTPSLLEDAVEFIDSIYEDIDDQIKNKNQHFHDIQGDVYEHLLWHTSQAGKNGQFRTKRHIIHMMAELLDPKVDGRICDLASGSGGFLVGAYQYMVTKHSKTTEPDDDGLPKGTDGSKLTKKQWKTLKEDTFYGFDIDQTMVRIGVMNLMMHGIEKPHIVHLDSLSTRYEQWEAERLGVKLEAEDKKSLANPALQGQYKYIMANPPFTGKINSDKVSENIDRTYPPQYDNSGKRKKRTVQSELLFLERMVYMLEEGGRAVVIVPEGVLFNSGGAHKTVREILMTDCNLQGVISMPSGVFYPYTGVKTSILIFEKRKWRNGPDKAQNMDVWFYEMKSDGYTLDNSRKRLKESPLPEVVESYRKRDKQDQSDRRLEHFSIPFYEIKENGFEINFNLYRDFVYEPLEFEPSERILQQLKELEEEIQSGLNELIRNR